LRDTIACKPVTFFQPAFRWPDATRWGSEILFGSGADPNCGGIASSSPASRSDYKGTQSRPHILVVEDNKADVFLIRSALVTAEIDAELHVVSDGEKAVRFFAQADEQSVPCPCLIILDINLPKQHGGEVLRQMRTSKTCADALVVVVTSSDSPQDRKKMAEYGADRYFRKSSEYREYMVLGDVVRKLLETQALPDDPSHS